MVRNKIRFNTLKSLHILIILVMIGLVGWYLWQKNNVKDFEPASITTTGPTAPEFKPEVNFDNPKKGAHFETSTPAHASTTAAVPTDIVIDFNFDLAGNSTIEIKKDGKDY